MLAEAYWQGRREGEETLSTEGLERRVNMLGDAKGQESLNEALIGKIEAS
jgi:hypothetical protein